MKRYLSIAAIIVFLLSFCVYTINLRPIGSGDTIPTALVPITVIAKGTIVMDQFRQYFSAEFNDPYFFHKSPIGYVSSYPIATGLLITPFYFIPVSLYTKQSPTTPEWITFALAAEKIAASLIAALSVMVFFFVALSLSESQWTAIILTAAFAFGSQAWSVSSQALWMHGPGVLFILLACLIALDQRDRPSLSKAIWLSIVVSISVLIRPTNVLFAAPLLFWLAMRERRYAGAYALPAVIFASLLVSYNLFLFDNVMGYYSPRRFDGTLLGGLAGVLLSPSRGLFLYFPVAVFGLLGSFIGLKNGAKDRSFFLVLIAFIIFQTIVVSRFDCWWGGWSYGPRYMTEIQPVLLLLAVPFLEAPKYRVRKWTFFAILLAWSVFIQAAGAFLFPIGSWNAKPADINLDPERLWDFRDNPVRRDVVAFLEMKGIIKADHLVDFDARYDVTPTKIEIDPGWVKKINVSVTNTGRSIWYDSFSNRHMQVDLSYHIVSRDGRTRLWEGNRVLIPSPTKPNVTVELELPIRAPMAPGTYIVEISMVEEGVRWFSTEGIVPATIEMVVR